MDPRGDLTTALRVGGTQAQEHSVAALFGRDAPPATELILTTKWEGLDLLAASPRLAEVWNESPSLDQRYLRLGDALRQSSVYTQYDAVLFDAPSGLDFNCLAVLAAARQILVPVQLSGYATAGLADVLGLVLRAIAGLVPTFVNLRTRFSRDLLEQLKRIPNLKVFDAMIGSATQLQEAMFAGIPITAYDPGSRPAEAYRALASEVLNVA